MSKLRTDIETILSDPDLDSKLQEEVNRYKLGTKVVGSGIHILRADKKGNPINDIEGRSDLTQYIVTVDTDAGLLVTFTLPANAITQPDDAKEIMSLCHDDLLEELQDRKNSQLLIEANPMPADVVPTTEPTVDPVEAFERFFEEAVPVEPAPEPAEQPVPVVQPVAVEIVEPEQVEPVYTIQPIEPMEIEPHGKRAAVFIGAVTGVVALIYLLDWIL